VYTLNGKGGNMKTLNSRSKAKKETVDIHEEFISYQIKPLDSKYRITLGGRLIRLIGKRINAEAYQIFVGRNGDILLRPSVFIPSNEAWVYQNPEVVGKLRKGLREAGEGKTERVEDLESFLEKL
jgi:hypothetical protein